MNSQQRVHPVSGLWISLIVFALVMAGIAPVLAAPVALAPDLAPAATTVSLDGTPTVYKVTSSSGTGSSSNITFSHTTGTGSNRLLVVGVSYNAGTNVSPVSSVTFTYGEGTVLTLSQAIGKKLSWLYRFDYIYYSPTEPPIGTSGTIQVTFGNSVGSGIVAGAANFANVDLTTPIGPSNGAENVSAAPNVTVTGLVGDELVFDNLFMGGTSPASTVVGTGQTILTGWNTNQGNSFGGASTKDAAESKSVTMSWTPSGTPAGTFIWIHLAAAINPACTGSRYTLTLGTDPNGTAAQSPAGTSFCAGRTVTLTPAPTTTGYVFSGWGGTNGGDMVSAGGGAYTIVMDGNKSVTANFALAQTTPCPNTANLNAVADTFISGANTSFNYGGATTLQVDRGTAATTRRYTLLKWDVSSIPANALIDSARIVLNVTDDSTTAVYPMYDVTKPWVEGAQNGAADTAGASWTNYNTTGPYPWGSAGAQTTGTGSIDHDTLNLWGAAAVSFTPTGSKTVALSADGLTVVRRWLAGGVNNGVLIQLTASGASDTLAFDSREGTTPPVLSVTYCLASGEVTHDLTVTVDPSVGGTTNPSAGTHTYAEGATVNVIPTPAEHYEFTSWEGACSGTDPDVCQVTMDADKTVTAKFTAIPQYTLTVTPSGPGTVTLDPAGGTYYRDTVVTLTPVPNACATFSSWSGTNQGDIINTGGVYTIVMTGDKTVQANFTALPQFTLTAGNDGNGTVTLDPAGGPYCTGTTVTLTPVPGSGYVFDSWSGTNAGDIDDTAGVYTILMDANKSVTANFAEEPPPYLDGAVSSNTAGSGGSISVSHTTGTGTDRLMLVGVSWNCGSIDRTISSVTFTPSGGGDAITLDPVITQQAGTQLRYSAIYRWPVGTELPSGQAGTLTITFSGSVSNGIMAGVANFAGVDQTTPLGTPGGAGSGTNDTAPTVTLTGLNGNELVFDNLFQGAASNTQTLTVGPGQTVLWYPDYVANLRAAASTERATGSSVTMSWTASSASYWAIAAVPINPVAAGLRLLGDVDMDGLVNSTDALIVLSADAGLDTTVNCPMNYGDVNADGYVNSTDALAILTYDAKLSVPYPLGQPAEEPTLTAEPPGCSPAPEGSSRLLRLFAR